MNEEGREKYAHSRAEEVYGLMTNGGKKKKEEDIPSQEDGEMG